MAAGSRLTVTVPRYQFQPGLPQIRPLSLPAIRKISNCVESWIVLQEFADFNMVRSFGMMMISFTAEKLPILIVHHQFYRSLLAEYMAAAVNAKKWIAKLFHALKPIISLKGASNNQILFLDPWYLCSYYNRDMNSLHCYLMLGCLSTTISRDQFAKS